MAEDSLPNFLRQEAEALAAITDLNTRLPRLAQLVVNARLMHGLLDREDELIKLAGLTPTQFWWLYVPRQCSPERYADDLARMTADPAELAWVEDEAIDPKTSELRPRHSPPGMIGDIPPLVSGNAPPRYGSMVPTERRRRDALRRAYQRGHRCFVRLPVISKETPETPDQTEFLRRFPEARPRSARRPRPVVEVLTDDAGRYLAEDPRTRQLLPPGYIAFLAAGGHAQPYPEPAAPPAHELRSGFAIDDKQAVPPPESDTTEQAPEAGTTEQAPSSEDTPPNRKAWLDPARLEAVIQFIIAHSEKQTDPQRKRVRVSDREFMRECCLKTGATQLEYKQAIKDERLMNYRPTQGRINLAGAKK